MARHHNNYPNITIRIDVEPEDLIVYADENLITQVVLNLLKNAMQAIGHEQENGLILFKAYCDPNEAVILEVTNNGPIIPPPRKPSIYSCRSSPRKKAEAVSGCPSHDRSCACPAAASR